MHVFAFNPKGAFTAQCSKWSVFFFELTLHRVILRTPEALLCFAKWGKNQISLKKKELLSIDWDIKGVSVLPGYVLVFSELFIYARICAKMMGDIVFSQPRSL